jgi:hypothetical protein
MPVPIIDLQRRLSLGGAIRAGGEKGERQPGRKLDKYRLTSPRKQLIEQAAELYGGKVEKWRSPVGDEFQVYTEVEELPVLVMPGYSLRQSYELWEGVTKRLRLCDGIDEELSGGPCVCAATGEDQCDLYTRLVVALPELDTALGWRLITRGANAAHELPTMMALIESRAAGQTFAPARLRIDERRGVRNGQVVRFVVPVLDLMIGYAALAQGDSQRAINGRSYQPVTARSGSVDDALAAVQGPRSGLSGNLPELPDADAGGQPEPAPEAPNEDTPNVEERQTKALTSAQAKKLNVLVGQLRDAAHITTRQLWQALAKERQMSVEPMIELLNGRDDDGELHWSPLRDSLLRPEAIALIDRLEALSRQVTTT